jgi:hypothetical protein
MMTLRVVLIWPDVKVVETCNSTACEATSNLILYMKFSVKIVWISFYSEKI